MSNKIYDVLKFIAQIFLPAVATLYFALAGIWHLPNADQVVGTIVAVDTFLGVLLGLQARSYATSDAAYDGVINVLTGQESTTFSMELNSNPEDLVFKRSINFKVNPQ